MAFIPLEKALTELPPAKESKLEHITEPLKNSSLTKVTVDIERDSIRYLDSDSSRLLMELKGALNPE